MLVSLHFLGATCQANSLAKWRRSKSCFPGEHPNNEQNRPSWETALSFFEKGEERWRKIGCRSRLQGSHIELIPSTVGSSILYHLNSLHHSSVRECSSNCRVNKINNYLGETYTGWGFNPIKKILVNQQTIQIIMGTIQKNETLT